MGMVHYISTPTWTMLWQEHAFQIMELCMPIPGYLIAQINVKDYPQYIDEYGMPVFAMGTKHGAEFLAATPDAKTMEGEWAGNWTVIVRFPSQEAAIEFYNSEEYAPLRDARMNSLSDGGNVVIVEGLDVAALEG